MYDEGLLSALPYTGNGNMVVRDFMADPSQFKPKDEADRIANMEKISKLAAQNGLPVFASYLLDFDWHLPTYALYYAAEAKARPEDEVRLRMLRFDGKLKPAILEKAGIKIFQTTNDYPPSTLAPRPTWSHAPPTPASSSTREWAI